MTKEGERVGAIYAAKDGVIWFLGYGVYDGDHPVPAETHGAGHMVGIPNPRIKLDSGKEVFGFQCWWGPEKGVASRIEKMKEEGYVVVDVEIGEKGVEKV